LARVIVADASWVIALRDPVDPHHESAWQLNLHEIDTTMLLHPVTLAECLVGPAKMSELESSVRLLRQSFEIVDVDVDAPIRWAELRAAGGLRLPDAIVLDTALHFGATAIATFDHRLASAAAERGLGVLA
jgi:predicted nucleic acid-binding protein